jgi:hypothetical protein
MPAKTTRDAHISLLLPMAISQGWNVTDFARKAQLDNGEAGRLLKKAAEEARNALERLEAVDALALSVEIGGKQVTLGKVQGGMVANTIKSLARLPEELDAWTESNDKTYRRCQTVLRDAKALGLIRFGESDKAGTPPAVRHVDPFMAQNTPGKQVKSEKPLENEESVNDSASRCEGEGADNPPAEGAGEE